jgi:osmotically-inducible protein OsmY
MRDKIMTRHTLRWFPALVLLGSFGGCAQNPPCRWHACHDDAEITSQIRSAIDEHSELGAPNEVTVDTRKGVVYLSGLVSAEIQSQAAERLAEATPGVTRVENRIAVSD